MDQGWYLRIRALWLLTLRSCGYVQALLHDNEIVERVQYGRESASE